MNDYLGVNNNGWGGGVQTQRATNMMSVVPITDAQTVRSYPVAANNTVFFIDFNNNRFYIKSTNEYGIQNPTRSFTFTEEIQQIQNQTNSSGVSREEFEAQQRKLDDMIKLLEDLTAPSK